MRKITQNAVNAFLAGQPFAQGNTTVTVNSEGYIAMYLHGNLIARRGMLDREIEVTLAGWPTVTTRERINGLLHSIGKHGISQQNHRQIMDGREIGDHEWIKVVK